MSIIRQLENLLKIEKIYAIHIKCPLVYVTVNLLHQICYNHIILQSLKGILNNSLYPELFVIIKFYCCGYPY